MKIITGASATYDKAHPWTAILRRPRTHKGGGMSHVWVVEMDCLGIWKPVKGIGITRADCRKEKRVFKFNNPDDKFRVRKYVRAE